MKSPIRLNALRAFEASARHRSFSAAADELHVTPAAVGQMVRSLEEWLGAPLFLRSKNGRARLVTTEAAEDALPDIRAGFDRLALGLEQLKTGSPKRVLTVTLSPSLATKWLMPRIGRFHSAWPDIDLHLDTDPNLSDFLARRIDIGVRYGPGNWSGLVAHKLADEEVFPVCSPMFLFRRQRPKWPKDLLRETLIHDLSMEGHASFPTWTAWFQKAGVSGVATACSLRTNSAAAVVQSAIDGHGVALARSLMARDDLASGRLVRLFPDISLASPFAYFIVYLAEHASLPKLVAFRDWALSEGMVS